MDLSTRSASLLSPPAPDETANLPARETAPVSRTPLVGPKFTLAYYYLVGLAGLLVLVGAGLNNPQSLSDMVKPANFFTLVCLSVACSVSNFFPFRIPPDLYLALSMVLYLASFIIFPAFPAAISPVIGSAVFEFFVVKRGPAFAARTCGMYAISAVVARQVYELTGGQPFKEDFSFNILLPILVGFLVFRALNELFICLNLIFEGYKFKESLSHVLRVTGVYLIFLPIASLLAMLKFGNGPLAFGVGCTVVVIISFIINRAFSTREKESQQLSLVRELNEQLANQNERQRLLGLRINQTLTSFLPLVHYYTRTSLDQETAVSQIATTIEELSRTASQIAGSADNVAVAADQARDAADSGQQPVNATIEAINEVRITVQEIAAKISELEGKSERIGEIVTVINGIAGEIRLLALNATIEASGAGQFGRRFAVVANEVNLLADRSREALKQIKEIIAEIQAATVSSRKATIEGLSRMERSMELAADSEKANQEIISVVLHTAQAAAAISLATQQQRNASEQVVTSVHHVAARISQNADKISSVAQASAELENVASELQAERQTLVRKLEN
jgi:methyl-accepting chemotaxis protein